MTAPAISVERIGKEYQIGLKERRHTTFREALVDVAKTPLRRFERLSGRTSDDRFWALRDVSFEVPHGEVLGIIGRNGAGKSTLLKILSRITEPTTGRATINGRVASLLEVGTGFHNELTGRENVYLNGAILGMSRAEIDRKFDAIVDFSGVERFLDTPIKRYSSGMKVRLAFAVAAHLEPEILIIDEVLAVGDQEFQNKCLGKMNEVATSGRTVLFVSHNMAAVEGLCSRVLCFDSGAIVEHGETTEVISKYLRQGAFVANHMRLSNHPRRAAGLPQVLKEIHISDRFGDPLATLYQGKDIRFDVSIQPVFPIRYARLAIRIFNASGQRVTTCHSEYQYNQSISIEYATILRCLIKNCRLAPGNYTIDLQLDDHRRVIDRIESCVVVEIAAADLYGTGRSLPAHAAIVFPDVEWSVIPISPKREVEQHDRSES